MLHYPGPYPFIQIYIDPVWTTLFKGFSFFSLLGKFSSVRNIIFFCPSYFFLCEILKCQELIFHCHPLKKKCILQAFFVRFLKKKKEEGDFSFVLYQRASLPLVRSALFSTNLSEQEGEKNGRWMLYNYSRGKNFPFFIPERTKHF